MENQNIWFCHTVSRLKTTKIKFKKKEVKNVEKKFKPKNKKISNVGLNAFTSTPTLYATVHIKGH